MEKQLGQKAKAGPCRDPAIPAAGVVDGDQMIDDIDLDKDVSKDRVITEDETLGVLRGEGAVATKEEKEGDTPSKSWAFTGFSRFVRTSRRSRQLFRQVISNHSP